MYQSILLAADGSDNSYRAAEETLHFIGGDTEVTILNVVNPENSKDEILHNRPGDGSTFNRKAKLSKIIALYDENGVSYDVQFKQGSPAETVVDFANEGGYDVVILGSRGLNALQEMVLGSVSHKVAKRAHMPVMIVK
ncbi:universal stress protein [Lacicoccus alkaliphilus]|uniref:Nucleotide-binding universal stress protein, UspA family n=1 Tax=Lacicoccus alkaliphilus DSM 16010 TaxID=1123231 RepID=A0A1M7GS18_9BACL|nr:universal stress protein [Salinicoccus alkaliphilus]SHM18955.1 Nucleotide-binding universal stress protein, UspA family [Salinicoccus alkaliphilus DSM 16010]